MAFSIFFGKHPDDPGQRMIDIRRDSEVLTDLPPELFLRLIGLFKSIP